jgi:hypothetical protein
MEHEEQKQKPSDAATPQRLSVSFVVNDQGEEIDLLDYLSKHPGETLKIGDKVIQLHEPMKPKNKTSSTESDEKQRIADLKLNMATQLFHLFKNRAKRLEKARVKALLLKKLQQKRASQPKS